ncbi:MAG TPA: aspartate--tRNA ligase [Vicinamibacteria bacterium]|nr:aspartate--tRNA ligase [Vicinamibacteria bacterium]
MTPAEAPLVSAWKRTHSCGALASKDVGAPVTLMGWVDTVRDLGGITFIDLRDREGITQILVPTEAGRDVVDLAKGLGAEWVVAVRGEVLRRAPSTVNPGIATGEIEVRADEIRVLSESKTPPFELTEQTRASEDLRLRYRYLDIRRGEVRRRLEIRSRLTFAVRRYLMEQGFHEIETPYLTKSTPEGARDYLVPSRVHKGSFYALPQSPQLFKQLLMIAGMERYFQIVRCFRDEDLRADRQPEFTQIDIEMSFVDREDVFALAEGMFVAVLGAVEIEVKTPFPRMTYDEAMSRYGSDKPDLRFGLEIADISDVVRGSGYGIFEKTLEAGGAVKAIAAPGLASASRKEIDDLEAQAKALGAAGLGWAQLKDGELKSPLLRHLGEDRLKKAFERASGGPGDLLLVVASAGVVASTVLGALRLSIARKEGLIPKSRDFALVWVTDFPYFEYSETEGRWNAIHHPFTSPFEEDLWKLETDQGSVRALAYDLVANGFELGGGSIRIHRNDVQAKVFRALGMTDEEARDKFGFFLEALQYGAPPHGGIAFGVDRIAMLAAGGQSLRDVIAFPKTTSAYDLMTGSPSPVSNAQLEELGIRIAGEVPRRDR